MTPQELDVTGWPSLVDCTLVYPSTPSSVNRVIDFFAVSNCIAHAVHSAVLINNAGNHPRPPVRLYLRSQPRAIMFRQLQAPKKVEAVLPHGRPIFKQFDPPLLPDPLSHPIGTFGLDPHSQQRIELQTAVTNEYCEVFGLLKVSFVRI